MRYEFVRASEIDRMLKGELASSLGQSGFQMKSARAYVRSRFPGVRDLIIIQRMKGATYAPHWGFSLDYVPHISKSGLRWHRTDRTARIDLGYDPLDYLHPDSSEFKSWTVSVAYGPTTARREIRRMADMLLKQAASYLDQVEDESDLPAAFRQQVARDAIRFGFYNYSEQPIAYAFTLARHGQRNEAIAELHRAYAFQDASPELQQELEEMIQSLE